MYGLGSVYLKILSNNAKNGRVFLLNLNLNVVSKFAKFFFSGKIIIVYRYYQFNIYLPFLIFILKLSGFQQISKMKWALFLGTKIKVTMFILEV